MKISNHIIQTKLNQLIDRSDMTERDKEVEIQVYEISISIYIRVINLEMVFYNKLTVKEV